ncbi:MAG: VWA domain-containing protein, partial [Terriglobales bacterium]
MHRPTVALLCSVLSLGWLMPAVPAAAQQAAQHRTPAQSGIAVFKSTTAIVLVNLTVRDAQGNLVTDLKPGDITVLEDNKPQRIRSFEFESVDAKPGVATAAAAADNGPEGTVEKGAPAPKPAPKPAASAIAPAANVNAYRDRRLMVLYFDLTTMQPEDVQNVMQQAETFVKTKMSPADEVAIATLGDSLQLNQDFTDNKALLL